MNPYSLLDFRARLIGITALANGVSSADDVKIGRAGGQTCVGVGCARDARGDRRVIRGAAGSAFNVGAAAAARPLPFQCDLFLSSRSG